MDLSELDESTSSPANPLKAFDAFPKIHQSYRHSRSSRGGIVSVALLCVVTILFWTELVTWWRGAEIMKVSVEEGVGHGMQLNVDITIAMACEDLDLNVLDSTGDRIMAADELSKEPIGFVPNEKKRVMVDQDTGAAVYRENVKEVLAAAKVRKAQRRFRSRLSTGKRILGAFRKDMYQNDACRVYGQLEIHKCNGDFHITARGHGYQEVHGRGHLDHDKINFTHIIDELSFGEYFPNIVNPLDDTSQATTENLYRFQYFVSVVPTIYVADDFATKVIETNQYAVTDHRHPSAHHMGQEIPGIFFKYDVEPLQLTVLHGHISTYKFLMRLIALIGGVMACTEWVYKGVEGLTQFMERRKSGRKGSVAEGLLNGVIEKSN